MRHRILQRVAVVGLMLCTLCAGGCLVGQAPGKGKVMRLREAKTGGAYYVYLPQDYVAAEKAPGGLGDRRWPLVVTFHGMRPFDDAGSQVREWQQEADRYGFVVLAPKTATSDLLRQLAKVRVTRVHGGVQRDEKLTLGAMDEISRRLNIDTTKVLSTSWSSGGYLAHYMVNRHPERFSCIAPRQSNFSSDILDEAQVPKYRDMKVGIFYTENDFAICRRESQEGAQWYARNGFDVTFAVFRDLGHERRPSVAADFFARQIGAPAKTPPTELARMQVKRVPLKALNGKGKSGGKNGQNPQRADSVVTASQLTGQSKKSQSTNQPANAGRSGERKRSPNDTAPAQKLSNRVRRERTARTQADRRQTGSPQRQPTGRDSAPAIAPSPSSAKRNSTNTANVKTPHAPRENASVREERPNSPLTIRLSSTLGIVPHHVTYTAVAPAEISRDAYFLWMANGEPISNGTTGQKYFVSPGKHLLELMMTTADGRQYYAKRTINVLERLGGKDKSNK
jgi:dienelactone hydrolase